jgi:hypothetical protein
MPVTVADDSSDDIVSGLSSAETDASDFIHDVPVHQRQSNASDDEYEEGRKRKSVSRSVGPSQPAKRKRKSVVKSDDEQEDEGESEEEDRIDDGGLSELFVQKAVRIIVKIKLNTVWDVSTPHDNFPRSGNQLIV